jgi:drug/metabolite transporter (DMT)-like permease
MAEQSIPALDPIPIEARRKRIPASALAQVVGTTFLWGFTPTLVKLILPVFDPFAIAFLRYLIATIFLLGVLRARGKPWRWPKVSSGLLLLGGLGAAFNYFFQLVGLKYTTASASSFIIQGEAVALLFIAWLFLGERWTRLKAWGSLVCTVGVLIVGWNGVSWGEIFNSSMLAGNVLTFFGGVSWAVYAACQKVVSRSTDALQTLAVFFLLATLITGLVWPFMGTWPHQVTPTALLGILLLGTCCTGLGYLLLAQAMRTMDAGTTGMWTTPLPVFASIIAYFALGEKPSLYTWAGGSLVLAGLLILSREEV